MVTWAPQVRAFVVFGAVLAVMLGCDSPARVKPWRHAPDPAVTAAAAPRPPDLDVPTDTDILDARPHTLRIHVDSDPGRLTALAAPSVWSRRITNGTVFEPLLRYVPGEGNSPGHYAPRLAKSWRIAPGGGEIRIELEDNVVFHDGHLLTTSDVQFTLDAIRDPRNHIDHLRPLLDDVFSVELLTSREMNIVLKRPNGWILRALAEIPILPMHVYNNNLAGGGQVVGTGPWKLTSNKNGIIHLSRHDKYWGRPPAISDVEFVYEPDAARALTEAKRGEIDILPALIPVHLDQAEAPGIAASFDRLDLAPPRMRAIAFNASHAPLDDARVRQAIALLIDRKTIATKVYDNLERPAGWPVWPTGLVIGPELPAPPYDPAAAGKLLDAAGWVDSDKDGFRDKNGKPLRLVLIAAEKSEKDAEKDAKKDMSGPPVKSARDIFVDAAHRAGLRIEVRPGNVNKKFDEGNWDLVEVRIGGMVDSDISALVTGKHHPEGTPRIDRALDALAAAWDPAERWKAGPEMAAALEETWPFTGIVADSPHGLVNKRVQGVQVFDGWLDLTQLSFAK